MDVFVWGEGSSGELGLGVATSAIDVKRPRLHPYFSSIEAGFVHVATGGMHAAALTHDNLIYTWGVNDQGALGRDTACEGGMREVANSDDEAQEMDGLNPVNARQRGFRVRAFLLASCSYSWHAAIATHLPSLTMEMCMDGLHSE